MNILYIIDHFSQIRNTTVLNQIFSKELSFQPLRRLLLQRIHVQCPVPPKYFKLKTKDSGISVEEEEAERITDGGVTPRNSVFQTQQGWHTSELTDCGSTHRTHTSSKQANSSAEKGKWTQSPTPN